MKAVEALLSLIKLFAAFYSLNAAAFGGSLCIRTVENVRQCDQYGRCFNVKYEGKGTTVVLNQTKTGHWVAVTAKHVIDGVTADQIFVGLDGEWKPISNVYRLETNDDAAFITFAYDGPTKLEGTPVAEEDEVLADTEVHFGGYSNGKTYEKFRAKTYGTASETGFATAETRPRQGQSGGGVYHRGRLIGIVRGYDANGDLIYTPIHRCRRQCVRQWGFFWGIGIGVPAPAPPVLVVPPPPVVQPQPTPLPIPDPALNQSAAPPPPMEDTPRPNVIPEPAPKPTTATPPVCRCKGGCKCDLGELQLTIEQLRTELAAVKAKKIPVQILRPDGSVFDQAEYTLGKPIKLKLAPVEK